MKTEKTNDLVLRNYRTGEIIRKATRKEWCLSVAAAMMDGGAGVIRVDGVPVYVEGNPNDR